MVNISRKVFLGMLGGLSFIDQTGIESLIVEAVEAKATKMDFLFQEDSNVLRFTHDGRADVLLSVGVMSILLNAESFVGISNGCQLELTREKLLVGDIPNVTKVSGDLSVFEFRFENAGDEQLVWPKKKWVWDDLFVYHLPSDVAVRVVRSFAVGDDLIIVDKS